MLRTMGRAVLGAALLAAVAGTASAKDLAGRLRGSWTADKKALFEMAAPPYYKMATPEKQKEMLAEAMKSTPDMGFVFAADTLTANMGGEAQVATYKITKIEKNTVFFDALAKAAADKPPDSMYAEFVDDDTVKVSKVGDALVLLLRRAK
jgi:hypothetical protein